MPIIDQTGGMRVVGRTVELDAVSRWLEPPLSGRGMIGLVCGPAGIGKTALLNEILAPAAARGYRIVQNRCAAEGGGADRAQGLLTGIGEFLLADAAQNRDAAGHLLEVAGNTIQIARRELDMGAIEVGNAASLLGNVLRSELGRLLALCSPKQPILVLFDDLDRAGGASRILIEALASSAEPHPIALIASFTLPPDTQNGERLRMWASRRSLVQSLALTPLDFESARELSEKRNGSSLFPEVAECLFEAAGGSPELLVALHNEGAQRQVRRRLGQVRLGAVPPRVEQLLEKRFGALGRIADAAAVIGSDFDEATVALIGEMDPEAARSGLATAQAAGIIRAKVESARVFDFVSPMVREFLYRRISPAARATMHGRMLKSAADANHALGAIELGRHLIGTQCSEAIEKARTLLREAAHRAQGTGRFNEAAQLYSLALDTTPPQATEHAEARLEMLMELGRCAGHLGDHYTEAQAKREALAIAERLGNGEQLAQLVLAMNPHDLRLSLMPDTLTVQAARRALDLLNGDSPVIRARVSARLAEQLAFFPEQRAEAERLLTHSMRLLEADQPPEAKLELLVARDMVLRRSEHSQERLMNSEQIVADAQRVEDHDALFIAFAIRRALNMGSGQSDQAEEDARLLEATAARLDSPVVKVRLRAHEALRAALDSPLDETLELWRERVEFCRQAGRPELADLYWPAMVMPLVAAGQAQIIKPLARETTQRRPWSPSFAALYGWICAESGDVADARFCLERECARLEFVEQALHPLAALAALGAICCRLGEVSRAAQLRPILERHVGRRCTLADLAVFGTVDYHLGGLYALLGEPERAIALFEHAINLDLAAADRIALTLSKLALGRCLIARAHPQDLMRAETLMRETLEQARALNLTAIVQQIESYTARSLSWPSDTETITLRNGVEQVGPPSGLQPGGESDSAIEPAEIQSGEPVTGFLLHRAGDYWIAARGDRRQVIKHVSGLQVIQHLMAHPGERFHVLELSALLQPDSNPVQPTRSADLGPALDAQARSSYGARIRELQQDLEQAREHSDYGRIESIESEIEFITRELSRAIGLNGRPRRFGSGTEKARLRITNAVKRAIRYVGERDRVLGVYLQHSVRTGNYCCYLPTR